MHDKIKILQLSPQFPFPMDDGGKISIGNLTKNFSKLGAEVTLFCFYNNKIPEEHLLEAEKYCKLELCDHSTKNTLLRIAKSIVLNKSIYLSKHINERIKKQLVKLINENNFDIIHCDHTSMAPLGFFAKSIYNIPIGLRLHNIEWIIWKRYADELRHNYLKKLYINRQAEILKNKEKKFIELSDIVFTISNKDLIRARELVPEAKVFSAPAGVDNEYWKPENNIKRNNKELILATTYKWIHNANALKWFLDEVFPKVIKKIPEIKLTLLGKEPPLWLKEYYPKNISVVGYVEDIRSYLNKANIYIAPLFVGSGIRIKILEAMAMELPVVATTVSAEGINAGEEEGLIICDDSYSFANSVIHLIQENSLARKMGNSARKFIINNFSWSKTTSLMLQEYHKLVTSRKQFYC